MWSMRWIVALVGGRNFSASSTALLHVK